MCAVAPRCSISSTIATGLRSSLCPYGASEGEDLRLATPPSFVLLNPAATLLECLNAAAAVLPGWGHSGTNTRARYRSPAHLLAESHRKHLHLMPQLEVCEALWLWRALRQRAALLAKAYCEYALTNQFRRVESSRSGSHDMTAGQALVP